MAHFVLSLTAPLIVFAMVRSFPESFSFLLHLTSNHNYSVIPFAISHCVNLMAATAFVIPTPARTTLGATEFATRVAQALVASMTLEIVAM